MLKVIAIAIFAAVLGGCVHGGHNPQVHAGMSMHTGGHHYAPPVASYPVYQPNPSMRPVPVVHPGAAMQVSAVGHYGPQVRPRRQQGCPTGYLPLMQGNKIMACNEHTTDPTVLQRYGIAENSIPECAGKPSGHPFSRQLREGPGIRTNQYWCP